MNKNWNEVPSPIVAKPKSINDFTSYLIDEVWGLDFGTIVPTSLMTAHIKVQRSHRPITGHKKCQDRQKVT
jgi:hypothetical protein